MMCIKTQYPNFSEQEFVETGNPDEIREVFRHGGRDHHIVYCQDCDRTHEYIGEENGVYPVQPALGWRD